MKSKIATVLALSAASSFATSVLVTNSNGPTASREVVTSTGALVAGFGAVGIIDEAGILGISTTYTGLAFEQWGTAAGGVTNGTSGQFSFTANINPVGTNFSGRNIYLLVGFGGTNLDTSTELFIYKFNTGFGIANSGTPINLTLGNGDIGTTLFGTEFGTPETTTSGRFRTSALAPVPEPSAALLGMLGALGLLRRRR